MRRSRLLVIAPLLGFATCLALVVTALLGISAIVGGASSQQGCGGLGAVSPPSGSPPELRPIFVAAASRYRLGSQGAAILAGLTSIESGFGENMGPSSAGAIGWTQFMPATWAQWGVDANGDGKRDPYNAMDAIFSSARYLRASGAPHDWRRALFAYNHSDAYVDAVLARARELAGDTSQPITVADRESGSVLVVGDSLEVGTFPLLNARLGGRLTGDFDGGRPSRTGIAVLRRMLPRRAFQTVVFDLGTNDATAAELQWSLRRLSALTGRRRIVLATVNSPFAERAKNELLRAYARDHLNVSLLDWNRVSSGLGLPDGIHGAYEQRAALFARALRGEMVSAAPCVAINASEVGPIRRITGHGRLVAVPGQAGIQIDSRILPDVLHLTRTYHLTVTAGYSTSPVHKANGEHPLGLAVDLVPGPGGSWDEVDRLAKWAEPTQNAPRPPFRWVGYDGDRNHGRGNHLHLSWMHAPEGRIPVAWVDVFSTDQLST